LRHCVKKNFTAADLVATREEILETAAVALALNGGPAEWPIRFVVKVLEELESSNKSKEVL